MPPMRTEHPVSSSQHFHKLCISLLAMTQLFKEASLMKKEAQVYGYKNKYLESNSIIRPFNKVTKYSRFYFRDYDLHSHGCLTRIINMASSTIPA